MDLGVTYFQTKPYMVAFPSVLNRPAYRPDSVQVQLLLGSAVGVSLIGIRLGIETPTSWDGPL